VLVALSPLTRDENGVKVPARVLWLFHAIPRDLWHSIHHLFDRLEEKRHSFEHDFQCRRPGLCVPELSAVMPFSHRDLFLVGLVMGIALLLTSCLSVGAIVQRNHILSGFVILNWALIADAVIVLVLGTILWFYTLRERAEFHTLYANLQPSQRVTIQDMVAPLSPLLLRLSDHMISSAAVDISIRQTSS
jgi:hypothetical protein